MKEIHYPSVHVRIAPKPDAELELPYGEVEAFVEIDGARIDSVRSIKIEKTDASNRIRVALEFDAADAVVDTR